MASRQPHEDIFERGRVRAQLGERGSLTRELAKQRRNGAMQLRDMDEELGVWRASYLEAIATTQSEWLQGRFMDREAVIAELQERVFRASELLEDFPRLS